MADIDYLPRNWFKSMRRAAAASDAVRNMLLVYNPEYHTLYTHFLGDALPGEWASAKTNGTSAAVTVASSQLTQTAGTDDNGYAGNGYGLFWTGTRGFYMETAFAIDTVTSSKIEIGVTDAVDDAGAVATKATPTATADDFVVLVRDTDDNTELDLISGSNTTITANAENVYTVVGATVFRAEFRGRGTKVAAYVNSKHVGDGTLTAADALTPWIFTQARAVSASRIGTAEYLLMTGPSGVSAI